MEGLSPNRSLNMTMRTTPGSTGSVNIRSSSRRSSRNTSIGSKVFSDYEDNDDNNLSISVVDENMEPNKSPLRSSNRSMNKSRLSLDSSTIVNLMENVATNLDDNNNKVTNDMQSFVLSAAKSKQKVKSKSVNNSMNKSTNNEISAYDYETNDNDDNEARNNEENENNNISLADMINKSVVSSTDGSPEVYKNYYAVLAGTPSVDMSTFSYADIQSDSGVSTGDKRSWSNRSPAVNSSNDNTASFNFKESDGRRVTADPADLATLIDDINNESVNATSDHSNAESISQQDSVSTSTTPSGKSPYRKKMNRSSTASNLEISIDLNETNPSVMSVSHATINLADDSADISFQSSKSPAVEENSQRNLENSMNISTASAKTGNSSTYSSSRLSLSAAKNGRRMTVDPADMEALINCLDDSGSAGYVGRESIDTAELMMSVEGATNEANVDESADVSMVSNRSTRSTRSTKSRKSIESVDEVAAADTSIVSTRSRMSTTSRKSDASAIPTPLSTNSSSRLSLSAAKNGRRMTVDPADMEALMGTLENESSTVSAMSIGRQSIDTAELMMSVEGVIDQSYESNISNTMDSIISRKSTPSDKACNSVTSSPRVIRSSTKKSDKKSDRRVTADPVDMALLINSLKDDDLLSPAKDSRRMTADPADMLALISGLESEDLNDSGMGHQARSGRESIDTVYLVESVAATLNGVDNDEMNESVDANSSYGSLGGLVCIDKSDNFTPTKSPEREKTAPSSILKSCLSSRKMIPQSLRKNVIFGSPKAAEFHKLSPTTSFTPLNRQEAKSLYSMSGKSQRDIEEEEDEATAENSKILEEWDRLTNNSENGSDDEFENEEVTTPQNASTLTGMSSASSRRRRSMLQPRLDMNTSTRSEVSVTVALPGNLADLIAETENMNPQETSTLNESDASKVSHTQELEMDLHSLLRQEYTGISEDSINGNLNSSAASSKDELHVSTSTGISNESSQRSLGPLLGLEPLKASVDNQNVSQSMDTTMSDVASNESEVSFRHSFGYRSSINGPYSALKANDSNMSMNDGHTVQLENKLGDMIANLGDDDSCILDGSIQNNQSHLSIRSDNDFTHGLENNLGALMQQIGETSNICNDSVQILDSSAAEDAEYEAIDAEYEAVDAEYEAADVSTATTEAANSMQDIVGATDLSIADTSVCISTSVDKSVSANIGASEMLERLRSLNAGARRNSLSQCGTPLASANRLSLGLPRLSIANFTKQLPSAKKSRTETSSKLDNSTIQDNGTSDADVPAVVDLDTLFATLGVDKNNFDKSSKLLDILKTVSNTEYDSFNIILNGIIADLLGAAASEIKASGENDKKLKELWANADVNSIRLASDVVIGNRKPAKQALIKLANQCTQVAERNWNKWEAKLLELTCQAINHQKETVSGMLETLVTAREQNEEKMKMRQAQDEEKSMLIDNNDHNIVRELQLEIRSARQELETMKKKLADIDEQSSFLMEEKMNRMIALSNGHEGYKVAVQNVSQNEVQLQELQEHENRLCETEQYVDIVNRLSYCSVLSYKSTGIVVEAQLSAGLSCIISFNFENKNDKLTVSNMNVDLESKSDIDFFDNLANAYFADVLASDEVNGPLSNRVLDNVTKLSDIPSLLRQISGYISVLRRMKFWLDCFTVDKWTWSVNGNRIVVESPDSSVLVIPLKIVASGNIAALSADCLQDKNGTPINVSAMRSGLALIQKACSAPFGSFPSHPLKKLVQQILKLN